MYKYLLQKLSKLPQLSLKNLNHLVKPDVSSHQLRFIIITPNSKQTACCTNTLIVTILQQGSPTHVFDENDGADIVGTPSHTGLVLIPYFCVTFGISNRAGLRHTGCCRGDSKLAQSPLHRSAHGILMSTKLRSDVVFLSL